MAGSNPKEDVRKRANLFGLCAEHETDPVWQQRFTSWKTRLPTGYKYQMGVLTFRSRKITLPTYDIPACCEIIKELTSQPDEKAAKVAFDSVPKRTDIKTWASLTSPRQRRQLIFNYAEREGRKRMFCIARIRNLAAWIQQGIESMSIKPEHIVLKRGLIDTITGLDIDRSTYPSSECKRPPSARWLDIISAKLNTSCEPTGSRVNSETSQDSRHESSREPST